MSTVRLFKCTDLFKFNAHNLNDLTNTNPTSFYLKLLAQWPEYCFAVDSPNGELIGYTHSKMIIENNQRHGHVSMIAVAPDYQKLGVGTYLLTKLENLFFDKSADYVDLYCRTRNVNALNLYKHLGYIEHRTITKMYSNGDDGLDMRKTISHTNW